LLFARPPVLSAARVILDAAGQPGWGNFKRDASVEDIPSHWGKWEGHTPNVVDRVERRRGYVHGRVEGNERPDIKGSVLSFVNWLIVSFTSGFSASRADSPAQRSVHAGAQKQFPIN